MERARDWVLSHSQWFNQSGRHNEIPVKTQWSFMVGELVDVCVWEREADKLALSFQEDFRQCRVAHPLNLYPFDQKCSLSEPLKWGCWLAWRQSWGGLSLELGESKTDFMWLASGLMLTDSAFQQSVCLWISALMLTLAVCYYSVCLGASGLVLALTLCYYSVCACGSLCSSYLEFLELPDVWIFGFQ